MEQNQNSSINPSLPSKLETQVDTLFLLKQPKKKDNNKFNTNKTRELTENQTVWKSDNQSQRRNIIRDGRERWRWTAWWRGLRAQLPLEEGGRQARQQLVDPMRQQLVHWMVPYSHADNLGGITWGAR